MTSAPRKTPSIIVCLTALLLLLPTAVFATHFEISRLATQLNLVSGQLAYELRSNASYGSIRQRADRLSREAADLVDAVRRNRSPSTLRSRFNDVSQRYASLEDAFLRANHSRHNPYLFSQLQLISNIYSSLSAEFFYGAYAVPARVYTYSPPVIINQYERVPPVHIQRGFVNPGNVRRNSGKDSAIDRRDYGRIEVQRLPNYDHRSPVQERQQRLDNRRHQIGIGGGNRRTETRRRNHYE